MVLSISEYFIQGLSGVREGQHRLFQYLLVLCETRDRIERYKPRPEEVERYVEEILLYKRVASLQYTPSEDEIRLDSAKLPCLYRWGPQLKKPSRRAQGSGEDRNNRVEEECALYC